MELFPVSETDISKIQEVHEVNRQRIEDDVRIVKEWMEKQKHLPQKLQCDVLIEKMLLHTKYSVERTKEKIESYFTLRNANKEFWETFSQDDKFLLPSQNSIHVLPLPKLGPNMERIYVFDFQKDAGAKFENSQFHQACIAMAELLIRDDWANGVSLIFDFRNYSLDYVLRTDLPKLARLITFMVEGCSSKVFGIHMLHAPNYLEVIINVAKTVLTQKLISKLYMHKDLESLHKMLSEKYLPVELGGAADSLSDLVTISDDVILKNRDYLKDCLNYVTDESLRIEKSKYDPAFGLDGTFKKLNVD